MEHFIIPTTATQLLPGAAVAVVAPHPDDEVLGPGGALAGLAAAGVPVHVLILTDGHRWAGADPLLRRQESCHAARILGYGAPEFWGLADGNLREIPDLAERLATWVGRLGADTLLAPSLWEMHRDHQACAQAAAQVALASQGRVQLIMYEIGVPLPPNLLVDITPWRQQKAQAVACFASQLQRQRLDRHIAALNRYRTYTLPAEVLAAEAFCLLDGAALGQMVHAASAHTVHLAAVEAEHQALRTALTSREATIGDLSQALAQREATIGDLSQALAQREATIRDLSQALAQREAELHTLLHSRSWRITAPLRAAAAFMRGERTLGSLLDAAGRRTLRALPLPVAWKTRAKMAWQNLYARLHCSLHSPANPACAQAQLDACHDLWTSNAWPDRCAPTLPSDLPDLDISLVTFNSSRWLPEFFHSLLTQDYPLARIHLLVVDNGSTDSTWDHLQAFAATSGQCLARVSLERGPNRGFGPGHTQAISQGSAPWVLVANPDLSFHPHSLTTVLAHAVADSPDTAAWELRQMPYEHPKHYHPVTWETTWNSHACVLLRRQALAAVGGYSPRIFLYGEDVELSFRLRAQGWRLRYCPPATVTHHTYAAPHEVKPAQFLGSVTANALLRLRYGTPKDMAMVPALLTARFLHSPFPRARRRLAAYLLRHLLPHLPGTLLERRTDPHHGIAPFRVLDYERTRHGAFVPAEPLTPPLPLVSIITRTMAGREFFLWQAGMSALRQTYPNLEWIVVEDGGTTQAELVERLAQATRRQVRYFSLPKVGRTEAGNRGLAEAQGEYLLFLDDDDLLYADHLETLIRALRQAPEAAAAYSLAMEVPTAIGPDGRIHEDEYLLHPGHIQPFDPEVLAHHNFIPIQAILFARTLWEERGGFDPSLEVLEDWNLWQRYAHGHTFTFVPKVTSLYRTPRDPHRRAQRQAALDAAYAAVRHQTQEALSRLP